MFSHNNIEEHRTPMIKKRKVALLNIYQFAIG
jgi:hypothetical protein